MTSSLFNISEIFYSIQGEGPFAGCPSIFVRFSGCNLRCRWGDSFCDTPYASWNAETNLVSIEQVVQRVKAIARNCKMVILTGGEPTLQNQLEEFCELLSDAGYELHIETNGLGPIPKDVDVVICSPKLADSTPRGTAHEESHEALRTQLHADLVQQRSRLHLKFVITPNTDWNEIENLVVTTGISRERVYVMPEGTTREEILVAAPAVAKKAMELGYRFSHRVHILMWNNQRGT